MCLNFLREKFHSVQLHLFICFCDSTGLECGKWNWTQLPKNVVTHSLYMIWQEWGWCVCVDIFDDLNHLCYNWANKTTKLPKGKYFVSVAKVLNCRVKLAQVYHFITFICCKTVTAATRIANICYCFVWFIISLNWFLFNLFLSSFLQQKYHVSSLACFIKELRPNICRSHSWDENVSVHTVPTMR